jgi:hypothetical protein
MNVRVMSGLIVSAVLAGCGQNVPPLVQVGRKIAANAQQEDTYGQQLETVTPEVLKQIDYPLLYVEMASTRDETFMRAMESNGGVETWLGASGTSLSVADSIVVATRGYGHDLASSRRPTLGELREYASTGTLYEVVYRHWDFEENLRTRTGFCEASETQDGIEELCSLGTIQFTNTYEIAPQGIKSSRQWVSPERGNLRTIRLK